MPPALRCGPPPASVERHAPAARPRLDLLGDVRPIDLRAVHKLPSCHAAEQSTLMLGPEEEIGFVITHAATLCQVDATGARPSPGRDPMAAVPRVPAGAARRKPTFRRGWATEARDRS